MPEQQQLTLASRIQQSQRVLSNSIDSETVLLNIQKSSYYGLDSIASRIWAIVAKPVQLEDLIQTLLEEYDVGRDACITDVLPFLQDLVDEGLIERIDA